MTSTSPDLCIEPDQCQPSGFRFRSRLDKLKVVKLEGFGEEKEVMALAWRLKKVCSSEPFFVVKSHWSDCLQFVGKVSKKRSNITKTKKKGKYSYKLKEGVLNVNKVCPDHVHMKLYYI